MGSSLRVELFGGIAAARKNQPKDFGMDSDQMKMIKREILVLGRICSGTLLERTKVRGKPNCRCAPICHRSTPTPWARLGVEPTRRRGARPHNVTPKTGGRNPGRYRKQPKTDHPPRSVGKEFCGRHLRPQVQHRKSPNRKIRGKLCSEICEMMVPPRFKRKKSLLAIAKALLKAVGTLV